MKLFIFLILSGLLLFSCTTDSAGGGSDTPNEIAGLTIDENTKSIANAKIKVYRRASIDSTKLTIVDSLKSDSDGSFIYNFDRNGIYTLVAKHQSTIGMKTNIIISDSSTKSDNNTLMLNSMTKITGSLNSNSTETEVNLLGTPFSTNVNTDGTFELDSLPEGLYSVTISPEQAPDSVNFVSNVKIENSIGVDIGHIEITPGLITLEDFENDNGRILLAPLFSGGWWWMPSHTGDSRNNIKQSVQQEDGNSFQKVEATIYPDTSRGESWGLTGFSLANSNGSDECEPTNYIRCHLNFSNATIISFRAKGSGNFKFKIGTQAVYDLNDYGHFQYSVQLSPEWVYYSINLSLLKAPTSSKTYQSGLSWEKASQKTLSLSFLFTDRTTLFIDDIQLQGALLNSL